MLSLKTKTALEKSELFKILVPVETTTEAVFHSFFEHEFHTLQMVSAALPQKTQNGFS